MGGSVVGAAPLLKFILSFQGGPQLRPILQDIIVRRGFRRDSDSIARLAISVSGGDREVIRCRFFVLSHALLS